MAGLFLNFKITLNANFPSPQNTICFGKSWLFLPPVSSSARCVG